MLFQDARSNGKNTFISWEPMTDHCVRKIFGCNLHAPFLNSLVLPVAQVLQRDQWKGDNVISEKSTDLCLLFIILCHKLLGRGEADFTSSLLAATVNHSLAVVWQCSLQYQLHTWHMQIMLKPRKFLWIYCFYKYVYVHVNICNTYTSKYI